MGFDAVTGAVSVRDGVDVGVASGAGTVWAAGFSGSSCLGWEGGASSVTDAGDGVERAEVLALGSEGGSSSVAVEIDSGGGEGSGSGRISGTEGGSWERGAAGMEPKDGVGVNEKVLLVSGDADDSGGFKSLRVLDASTEVLPESEVVAAAGGFGRFPNVNVAPGPVIPGGLKVKGLAVAFTSSPGPTRISRKAPRESS